MRFFYSDDALCAKIHPETWDGFVESYKSNEALQLCEHCPVRDACREFADKEEGDKAIGSLWGVWGGETPLDRFERRNAKKAPKKRKADACRKGHKYVEGSYKDTPTHRVCLVCRRVAKRRSRWNNASNKTCKQGHAWADGNFSVSPKGVRSCDICAAERAKKQKTHCRKGHELTGSNVLLEKRGARSVRRCLVCSREWRKKQKARK